MLVFFLLLAVGLPVVLSALIILARWPHAIPLAAMMALTLTGAGFSFFSASWAIFSYWALVPLFVTVAVALVVGVVKATRASWGYPGWARTLASLVFIAGAAAFSSYLLGAFRAMQTPPETLALEFPFRDGVFAVVQGGAGPPLQLPTGHAATPSQRYALDVVKLSAGGHSLPGYLDPGPGGPTAGITVHAPCSGEVVWARDEMPDTEERDLERPAGNVVAVACNGVIVSLGHLEEGSVQVREGEEVRSGDALGRVGISGSSALHHLHFHAERGELQGDFSDNEGVAMTFDGRFLWTGAIVRD